MKEISEIWGKFETQEERTKTFRWNGMKKVGGGDVGKDGGGKGNWRMGGNLRRDRFIITAQYRNIVLQCTPVHELYREKLYDTISLWYKHLFPLHSPILLEPRMRPSCSAASRRKDDVVVFTLGP